MGKVSVLEKKQRFFIDNDINYSISRINFHDPFFFKYFEIVSVALIIGIKTGRLCLSVGVGTVTGSATGGTFTLTFNSQTTSAIPYNVDALALQNYLQGL